MDFISELNQRDDIVIYKFADDGTIKITADNSQKCVETLDDVLGCLLSWTKKWRMKVNCDRNKTEVISFHTTERNKELIPKAFKLGDNEIFLVSETKVLGLTIDQDLSYKQHSQEVLRSLHAKWAMLCKYSSRHWGFNQNVMIYLIKALFISKLSYASHIWITKENIKEINKLWYHILKTITGAVLNISQNIAEVILGLPPIPIQTKLNSIKHYLKINIKPVPSDKYREFLATTYNEATKTPSTIHNKFKDIFRFLQWKLQHYSPHFNTEDKIIVNDKLYSRFFSLTPKSCTYTKELINKYIESIEWKTALNNQFQLDGYPVSPNPSCNSLPIPPNTPRESEVKLMSMLYKNNIMNSSLYKLGKVPSPLCSFCGLQEQTADHILFSCVAVEEELRTSAICDFNQAIGDSDVDAAGDYYIGLLNASRDPKFVSSAINIVKTLNLNVTVDL